MGKNFVLKDAQGRPGGYLSQGFSKLRCGMTDGREGELTLVYADGGEAVRVMQPGAQSEWPDDGRALLAAYAQCGERVYFTCERAKRAWERRQNERLIRRMKQERARGQAEVRAGARGEAQGDAASQGTAQKAEASETAPGQRDAPEAAEETERPEDERGWPQPRWPAPPCWPGARYVSGRWQD